MKVKLGMLGLMVAVFAASFAPYAESASAAKAAPIVWRMNLWFANTHVQYPHTTWAVEEIAKRSNGRLTIQLYPSLALGFKPDTWLRDHRAGLIDISQLLNIYVVGEEPSFATIESFMCMTKDEQLKAVDALGPFKRKVYKDIWNTELLATGVIVTNTGIVGSIKGKQVKTISDLKGLKMRVSSTRTKEVFDTLGAAPQFMPRSELYMALKTGVVDGFYTGWGSIHDEKFDEVISYAATFGLGEASVDDIIVSRRVWDPLPDDLKNIVRDVFGEWAERIKADSRTGRVTARDMDLVKKAGVTITEFSREDKAKIVDVAVDGQRAWAAKEGGRVAEAWKIVEPFVKK